MELVSVVANNNNFPNNSNSLPAYTKLCAVHDNIYLALCELEDAPFKYREAMRLLIEARILVRFILDGKEAWPNAAARPT